MDQEQSQDDGTVIHPGMEALSVWAGVKNARAAPKDPVNPGVISLLPWGVSSPSGGSVIRDKNV